MYSSPQADDTPVVTHPDAVAVPHRCPEHEPQAVHIGSQLHCGPDDLPGMGVWPEPWVVVAYADLLTLPWDNERFGGLHLLRLAPAAAPLADAWHATVPSIPLRA